MRDLYNELKERLSELESIKSKNSGMLGYQNQVIDARIAELNLVIIRVQQIIINEI